MTSRPPIADWPAGDRAAWNKGVEPAGLFGGGGAGAGWSDTSRFKTARGYAAWLSWLAAHDWLDRNLGAADRMTQERVAAYVGELEKQRAPYTVLCYVQELYDALRVIAPERDWEWLARLSRCLRSRVRPARDKLARLKPIDELAALGGRLMDEAESAPEWSARRRAVGYRDGLIIALLAYRPIRLKNLAMMQLGRHLVKAGGAWRILFSAGETKSRVPYEGVLPAALAPRLDQYLAVHRPILIAGEQADGLPNAPPIHREVEAVWVSEVGTQLEDGALGRRIFIRTRDAFGRGIGPHMFRDAAATSIAVDNPKHVGDASLVLGHVGHRTTEKHYNHARSLEASRRHAATLSHLHQTLKAKREG
jgi:integrase/recombinase XerD